MSLLLCQCRLYVFWPSLIWRWRRFCL